MSHDFRWSDYLMRGGDEFLPFWSNFLCQKERNVLFLLGHGFDPRMCDGIEAILSAGGSGCRDALVINYDEGVPEPNTQAQRENGNKLTELISGRGRVLHRPIKVFSDDGRSIGARSISNEFPSLSDFSAYSDLLVDISALPRGLYFPLLARLLTLFGSDLYGGSPNLHAIVAHSPELDHSIVSDGVEDTAAFLYGFSAAGLEREATREHPRIWIPLLGRGRSAQLERIYELVNPDEICPLLPSPSRNPREADDLVLEYRQFLFDELHVEPQNIIYASERNPFEVYRQLMRSMVRYRRALAPLGGCKVVLSAMSSKLISLGAVLAAHELALERADTDGIEVGVAHVDAQNYSIQDAAESRTELFSLWLCGECYRRS